MGVDRQFVGPSLHVTRHPDMLPCSTRMHELSPDEHAVGGVLPTSPGHTSG